MKIKTLFYIGIVALLSNCKQSNNNVQVEVFPSDELPLTVSEVLAEAENFSGKEVVLKGLVNHVCSHSGKRCFLIDGKSSIRVEAMGNITSFDRELSGNQILVKGILKEKQLDAQYIDNWESKTHEKQAMSEGNSESCKSDFAEIETMRNWMKENNKNYYSVWYVDGTDYELVTL